MITNWQRIVGDALAQHTLPEKIVYPRNERNNGILHLRIDSPALAVELQHRENQLIQSINTHFGYRAITAIRIIQGTLTKIQGKPIEKKRKITEKERELLDADLYIVSDPDLKNALRALGTEIRTTDQN